MCSPREEWRNSAISSSGVVCFLFSLSQTPFLAVWLHALVCVCICSGVHTLSCKCQGKTLSICHREEIDEDDLWQIVHLCGVLCSCLCEGTFVHVLQNAQWYTLKCLLQCAWLPVTDVIYLRDKLIVNRQLYIVVNVGDRCILLACDNWLFRTKQLPQRLFLSLTIWKCL